MKIFLEERRRRPRALWRLLLQFALFALLAALFTSLFAAVWFVLGPRASPAAPDAGRLASSPALFLLSTLASLAATLLSLWLAGRYLDRRPFRDFGFCIDRGWWLDLFFGMLLGALLMSGIFLVQLALGWVEVVGTFSSDLPGVPFRTAILLPLAIFVCVGVYEEALSRGYQLRNMAEGLNHPALGPRGAIAAAWVLSSLFFGLLHFANPNATALSTLNVSLAGILLGAGYVLTGQLAIPIGLHITWNFFQGAVYGFPVSGLQSAGASFLQIEQSGPRIWTGGPFGPEAGLFDPVAVLVGCLLIALWVRLRHGKVDLLKELAGGPAGRA
ncbi:hypothetical protein RxyAA322_22360 [Rubrobacter xylanophilus]|uniref:CAAX prenyl protease 2/Lysostaphin resistance protein A-like domain-containing protein n=1 Tax=Rubrobacter xylanophilus TaxID=49319 RepID=A0A510HK77_9ACTN|nr:CPBP family intramembrane glutamic endopeptidase [Rubrobacter xylanophilus]BBL80382.1 hypothetical protein RxyAA322_22360 [Rubrobacter xylanophilus]